MADQNNAAAADLRRHLTLDTAPPPLPIPKDMPGSDNSIPLSPQWLLPKPGDNKPGIVSGESILSPHYGGRPDAIKASGNADEYHDTEKRRDVFRPSVHDSETGRRDRWRDEERETNSAIRRDRWREGDKELGDVRRERWTDNLSRHSGEARRAPSERWSDSGNRENNYEQRRESKWNTRWGPDDKDSDNWREKWTDSGKDVEISRDKGMPHQTNLGKDTDREGDSYSRPWRPNSSQIRGRGEPSQTPNKQGQIFGYGRGRGENGSTIFSAGRGRISPGVGPVNSSSSQSYTLGSLPDKPSVGHGDSSTLKYSRMKLLDIYRIADIKNYKKPFDSFIEVPSLTQTELSEPLALSAPTSEEMVILKGIDKGDIVSSGMPQITKDGSVGRNSIDSIPSRQTKLENREDLSSFVDYSKDEGSDNLKTDQFGYPDSSPYEKHMHRYGSDLKVDPSQGLQSHQERNLNAEATRSEIPNLKKPDEASIREASMQERSSSDHASPWRSQSMGERSRGSLHDWKDLSAEMRSRTSDVGWSHLQNDQEAERTSNMHVSSSYYKDELHWQTNDGFHSETNRDAKIKRQSSEVFSQGRETNVVLGREDPFVVSDKIAARKFQPQSSPEELSLYYKDPQGQVQGPFSGSDLIGWFEAGYFGIDLQVCLADVPSDTPFSLLGDVMPHLRMKARPPPGFSGHKQSDIVDASSTGSLVGPGNVQTGLSDLEFVKSGQRSRHELATEAENRFLESLMSVNISSPPVNTFALTEGMKGYVSSTSAGMPTAGGEAGNDLNYILAQRMSLERQKSPPNHLPYWAGKDAASMVSKPELIPDPTTPHSKLVPPMADARQISQVSQPVDLLSLLQAAADKSPSPAVNMGVPNWSSFPDVRSPSNTVHGGMDVLKDKMDMHHNQHFTPQAAYAVQQQRLQQQNQPALSRIMPQPNDHVSGFMLPEKLLSSGISQDPQMLSILQQQYLLSQLQLQSPTPVPSQLSLLDKLLLIKQHQKQEQQLLQQQQLLSQVLSEHQPHQHFGEPAYGHLQATVPAGNAPLEHLGLRQPHETFHINPQMRILNLHDGRTHNLPDLPMQVPLDVGYTASSGPSSLHLPHQLFGQTAHPKGWGPPPQQTENVPNSGTIPTQAVAGDSFSSEVVVEKSSQETGIPQKSDLDLASSEGQNTELDISPGEMNCFLPLEEVAKTSEFISSVSEQLKNLEISAGNIPEQCAIESPLVKEVKHVEGREVKKTEKKSRKQKKTQLTLDQEKGLSRSIPSQKDKQDPEIEGSSTGAIKSDAQGVAKDSFKELSLRIGDAKSGNDVEPLRSKQENLPSTGSCDEVMTVIRTEQEEDDFALQCDVQAPLPRAWKPAPGLKAKSLLEIQREEQQRTQKEIITPEIATSFTPASNFTSVPWAGVVGSEQRPSTDILQGGVKPHFVSGTSEKILNSRSGKSQLHDVLAEEVLAVSNDGATNIPPISDKGSLLAPSPPPMKTQTDGPAIDGDDFVEAKDTKKTRKRAAKARSAGVKNVPPVASADILVPALPNEKSKSSRQMPEKESLPMLPAGPSLGDFVLWKGDQANTTPAPAWSTDSARVQKPASLRDILKEQEKSTPSIQQNPIPVPAKVQPNRSASGSASSWQNPGSPLKAASPIKSSSISAHSKYKAEDDLFWGPLDQPKQDPKRSDFPSLVTSSGWGTKNTPVKGAPGAASIRQKPSSGRTVEYSLSSSPAASQSSSKGKRGTVSKHSEAMDFRDWCENELARLTGTRDTGFLEFCLKQSTSEAEMLLRENLGSLDPKHEFIDQFVNYKELLPSDVIEIAFQAHLSGKPTQDSIVYGVTDLATEDADGDTTTCPDGVVKGGGKKKGKKGKKVSPSVLGFNVVSNRIMMGEIQNVED